jgi:hypothetical protein
LARWRISRIDRKRKYSKDIITTFADVLRVRALGIAEADGTLPLDLAVSFVEETRNMILAAACATIAPRSYWQRKPTKANEYVTQRARMGQTEKGSYVLTIHSPVSPELRTVDAIAESPFERRVMETLTVSLAAIREAAKKAIASGDLQPFQDAVPLGINANLCDAVVGISRVTPTKDFDVSVLWSRSRPTRGERSSTTVLQSW